LEVLDACDKNDCERLSRYLRQLGILDDTVNTRNTEPQTLLLRVSTHLTNWICALSAQNRDQQPYDKHVYHPSPHDGFRYILAYDLAGVRREHAKEIGVQVTAIDRLLNTIAENWIIAMGGGLSKTDLNSGDSRFGFFRTLSECMTAAVWIIYHCEQLSFVNRLMPKSFPFGMAITGGVVGDDGRGNLSGGELDWTGHWLKGKLKPALEHIAGNAGRNGRGYEESPIHFICHQQFTPSLPADLALPGKRYTSDGDGEVFEIKPLNWRKYIEMYPTPWAHYSLVPGGPDEEIAADEALWDAQFAATDDDKLAALVAAVEAEINEGKVLPMFDEHGEFIEHP